MKKRLLEKDLYEPVRDFLINRGFVVRAENNFCDVSAMKEDVLVIVELKRALNVELLMQGVKRQKASDVVYLAVPKPTALYKSRKWKDLVLLLRRLELGLMAVSFARTDPMVSVLVHPQSFDRAKSIRSNQSKREAIVREFSARLTDGNVGGSRGVALVTAYRQHAIYIATCLDEFGPSTPARLRQLGCDAKKTGPILINNFYKWFYRLEKGVYGLTDVGKKSVTTYNELYSLFKERLKQDQDLTPQSPENQELSKKSVGNKKSRL